MIQCLLELYISDHGSGSGKARPSGKCKFFMWLVTHDRCWTADRLARKGLPHTEQCLLCDQDKEKINHLLLHCVCARQVWFCVLQELHLQALDPNLDASSFDDWWEFVNSRVDGLIKKGLNSIIILAAWSLWNHRNRFVFDGVLPSLNGFLSSIGEEMH